MKILESLGKTVDHLLEGIKNGGEQFANFVKNSLFSKKKTTATELKKQPQPETVVNVPEKSGFSERIKVIKDVIGKLSAIIDSGQAVEFLLFCSENKNETAKTMVNAGRSFPLLNPRLSTDQLKEVLELATNFKQGNLKSTAENKSEKEFQNLLNQIKNKNDEEPFLAFCLDKDQFEFGDIFEFPEKYSPDEKNEVINLAKEFLKQKSSI